MGAQFLAALPQELTANILRFFSARPLAKNWKSFVSVDDAMSVCLGKGTVSKVSCRLFTAISTCSLFEQDKGRNALHFSKYEDAEQQEMFLRVAERHTVTLDLISCLSRFDSFGTKLSSSSILTSLKELYVFERPEDCDGLVSLLKILPSQLASLRIDYELLQEELDAVALSSDRLSTLEIAYANLNFKNFFAALEPKLESLCVSGPCSAEFFGHVEKYCRSVSELKLSLVDSSLGTEIASLAASYSTQLLNLTLGPDIVLDPFQLEDVSKQCPYSDFSLSCSWIEVANVMLILGDRLVSLKMSGPQEKLDEDGFGDLEAFAGCCT